MEGRTAEGLRDWLKVHPSVEVITRDRSGEYSRGAREGAPQAQQVADRWHLLQNLEQVLERILAVCYQRLRKLPVSQAVPTTQSTTERLAYVMRDYSKNELEARLAGREKRVGYFNTVQQLHQAGMSISTISRKLAMNRSTVRRYAYAESFPERVQRPTGRSMLTPYLAYLENRYQQGCRNAQQLWRELGQQGYPGAHNQIAKWLSRRRNEDAPMTQKQAVTNSPAPHQPSFDLPTTQQLAWLMVRPVSLLEEADRQILSYVCQDSIIDQVYGLVRDFGAMIRTRQAELLDDWLVRCQICPAVLLQQFGVRLQQDYAAVRAALATPWSNGQTKGQVTRLKLIKRQMYGRAKLDLLRQRVIYRC
ncbi:transposase [Spirosoma terrae]|uniref:Transposase n=1 Tax=Spirosoma terrae TaxID=1968276 RepID=A0A6L9L880_9BACT|nr:transposase [Spirosoma terrae]